MNKKPDKLKPGKRGKRKMPLKIRPDYLLFGKDTHTGAVRLSARVCEKIASMKKIIQEIEGLEKIPNQKVTAGYLIRYGMQEARHIDFMLADRVEEVGQNFVLDKKSYAQLSKMLKDKEAILPTLIPPLIDIAEDFLLEDYAEMKEGVV